MYVLIEFDLKLQRSVTTPGLWTVTLRLGPVGRGARSKADTTLGAPGHPGTNFFSQNQTKKAKKGPNEHLKPAHAAGSSRGNPFRPPGAVLQAGTPEHPGTAKQVPGEAGGAPK